MPLAEPTLIVDGGFILARGQLSRFDPRRRVRLGQAAPQLRSGFRFRTAIGRQCLRNCWNRPWCRRSIWTRGSGLKSGGSSRGWGCGSRSIGTIWGEESFQGRLIADYGRGWIDAGAPSRGFWIPEERVYVLRDAAAEERARDRIAYSG